MLLDLHTPVNVCNVKVVQYCGGISSVHVRVFIALWVVFSTVEDTMSTVDGLFSIFEDIHYCGEIP